MLRHLSTGFIFLLALLLGLRHGIDWDHIAAITDLVGSGKHKKQSLIFSFLYIAGHALVIVILGLSSVLIGAKLPNWIDNLLQPFVGATLVLLGIYLLITIITQGKNFKMRSRWMVIFALVHKIIHLIKEKFGLASEHEHVHYPEKYVHHTAFTIGLIHGIGAETPSQILLFVTAAGVGGNLVGSLLVLTFVAGLMLSNTLISVLSILGYAKMQKNAILYMILGIITAIFSLVVGTLFLLSKANFLPAIFGG